MNTVIYLYNIAEVHFSMCLFISYEHSYLPFYLRQKGKMAVTLTLLFLTVFGLSSAGATDGSPRVKTKLGTIIGTVKEVNVFGKQMKVERYHGIPYAEPPVGKLRFQYTVPKKPFTSPFEASKHGNLCYQLNMFPLEGAVYSEDCLFLNIYAPVVRSKPTPVMVWIHGGGFSSGGSNFYITDTLSAYGEVIVVTINYRLTLFGFLSTGDEHAPGNVGLMDQHLAMKWVSENIGAFGGDPKKVTIIGQSAGGTGVAYQSIYPGNEGLFQRAITQSGSLWWAPLVGPQSDAERLGKLVGCEQTESQTLIECLRGVPGDVLDTTLNNFTNGLFAPPVPFVPSFDGKFLREGWRARDTFESGKARDFFGSIDFMSGICAEEGVILMSPYTGRYQYGPCREKTCFGQICGFSTEQNSNQRDQLQRLTTPGRRQSKTLTLATNLD